MEGYVQFAERNALARSCASAHLRALDLVLNVLLGIVRPALKVGVLWNGRVAAKSATTTRAT